MLLKEHSPHLKDEWDFEKNNEIGLNWDSLTHASTKKSWWLCPLKHSYSALISNRSTVNSKCPYCSGKKVLVGFNDLQTTHPQLASQLVSEDPTKISKGSSKKVFWRCELGHEWLTSISKRVSGRGCPYCSGHKVLKGFNDLETKRPNLTLEWDDPSDPSSYTEYSGKKVQWKCVYHHIWKAPIYSRVSGNGCPYCSNKKAVPNFNDLATKRPDLILEWDDPSDPSNYTEHSGKRVQWKCKLGHRWEATIHGRSKGFGCPYCAGKSTIPGFNDLKTKNPTLALEWDDPSDITNYTESAHIKVWWKCKNGHRWKAHIYNRTNGTGCPKCANSKPYSKKEKMLTDFIKSIMEPLGHEVIEGDRTLLGGKEVDIYIPDKNVAIEFNGVYWHTEEMGADRHYHYNKWLGCKEKGVQLITIWEDEWDAKPDLVKSMLTHKLGAYTGPKVYARKTKVVELKYQQARDFLEVNHIQGEMRGSKYFALQSSDGEIVAVSVWSKRKTDLYLDRYATSVSVVGGMGKLLKYAISNVPDIEQVITFANHEVSDGSLYKQLGFTLEKELKPDYCYWYNGVRDHKFNFRLKRFKNDPELQYDPTLSEKNLAILNKIPRIWDSGKDRFILPLH